MMRSAVLLSVLFMLCSAPLFAEKLDFEDLTPDQRYDLDDSTPDYPESFSTGGVNVSLSTFFLGGGYTANGGAGVRTQGFAGGAGNEIWISNVNLNFDFGRTVSLVYLQFGEFGGNINLQVNGDQQIASDFSSLPTAIGGVAFTTSGENAPGSTIMLAGTIHSFSIGGQEFAIDNVVYRVPEPSSIILVLSAAIAVLTIRRRIG